MSLPINVLLIEDHPGNARWVTEELHSSNSNAVIQLKWIHSLKEGLDYIVADTIDAILLDLSLPDHGGFDRLGALLPQTPQIPVIVITSQADEEIRIKAMQAGAQDYLIKGQVSGHLLTRLIQYAIQRKQTEIQLADALALNEQILTASPVGILTYKLTGECVSANACVAQMVGATIEELLKQNFRELESWKRSGLYALAEKAIESKSLTAADVHVITSFGRALWVRAQFVIFKSGREELLLLTFVDITERKHAEAALEASEKRFRTWIESSLDLITVLDFQGIIQYQCTSITDLLGYGQDELLGRNAFEFLHPEDRDRIAALFFENINDPASLDSAEFRFRHRDGSWKFLEAVGRTYIDEHGERVALINSRDITQRKRVEESLREKEHLLSEAQRIGHIGSWSYDIPNNTITFSDEMYRLFDVLPEEFHHTSNDFLTLIYSSDRSLTATWLEDIKAGMQSKELNFRVFSRNGELRYLSCTGAVDFDSDGKPTRFIGTAQDVTERKVAEIQIKQQIKRLTALSEIDRAIMSSFDPHYTLGVILSQFISQLQVDAADILLLDPESQTLEYLVGQGFRTKLMETTHLQIGESHAGRAARERRMIRIADLRETSSSQVFGTFVAAEGL